MPAGEWAIDQGEDAVDLRLTLHRVGGHEQVGQPGLLILHQAEADGKFIDAFGEPVGDVFVLGSQRAGVILQGRRQVLRAIQFLALHTNPAQPAADGGANGGDRAGRELLQRDEHEHDGPALAVGQVRCIRLAADDELRQKIVEVGFLLRVSGNART